jgi:hypothetical protein
MIITKAQHLMSSLIPSPNRKYKVEVNKIKNQIDIHLLEPKYSNDNSRSLKVQRMHQY